MDKTIFNSKIRELQLAFNKKITDGQVDLYYEKLSFIDNMGWEQICDEIIENDEKFPAISRFYKSKCASNAHVMPKSCKEHGCTDGLVTLIDTKTLITWSAICPNDRCSAGRFWMNSQRAKNQIQPVDLKRPHTNFYDSYMNEEYNKLSPETKAKYERYVQKMVKKCKSQIVL